jgi:hypothetical protein
MSRRLPRFFILSSLMLVRREGGHERVPYDRPQLARLAAAQAPFQLSAEVDRFQMVANVIPHGCGCGIEVIGLL